MDASHQLFSAGSRVGQYLILEKLGEGGMSEVFKAIEPTLERYVAIKIMHRTNLASPEVMANFLEEARAIAGLRHTNIVPLYSAGEEQGVPYLAMGYIEGQTLEDWLLAGRILNLEDAMWFMSQAVAALEYAARLNIIHLDVKPANFMVDAEHTLMLTDFGLARKMTEVVSGARNDELQGTPAYASPEHVMQEKPDLRTDIYCLGASLFHLITGEFPYPGESTEEVCRAHVYSPFPIETLQRHNIPVGWSSLIRKMMEKKPQERFQNYQEIEEALQNINHFQYGKKMLSVVETVERRALPRADAGPPETLFDLIPDDMATQGEHLFTLQDSYESEETYHALDNRWPVLHLNEMASELRAMQADSSEDLRALIQALLTVPSYKETLDVLSTFMANASDARPQSDAEKIELVGMERSRNIALTAIALYRPWQSERPLNWHGLWQHQIYTGILTEFLVEMLGLPATGMEFLGGLVHDIGKLVLVELFPAKAIAVWLHALEQNLPLAQVEQEFFGVDHAQIGQEWLHRNKFHRSLRYLVAFHEDPENCYQLLMESSRKNLLTSMISSTSKDEEIDLLTHLVACANTLAKELGLGYSGNPKLDQTPWLEQPTTQLLFEARTKEEVTLEEFSEFFLTTCRGLPDLPFTQLAYASEARQRLVEKARREAKEGKK
jgi:serine/threonine protein kinase